MAKVILSIQGKEYCFETTLSEEDIEIIYEEAVETANTAYIEEMVRKKEKELLYGDQTETPRGLIS